METIKLANEQIIRIIPMGIDTNEYEKKRVFRFLSDLGYADIEMAFVNPDNISKIKYHSSAGELLKTYTDCISLRVLSKEFGKQVEDNIVGDVYSVVLEIS